MTQHTKSGALRLITTVAEGAAGDVVAGGIATMAGSILGRKKVKRLCTRMKGGLQDQQERR
ncbi:hypothetical protein HFC70_17795 [Agrobacterium sp. a22-2]|uniref:hypothetical protein n=1 Tax=Agrobacterium sp. a22-2 TaxID=2283840 RepID=UPI0014460207|nr:hypothetical protein [Agrobacterium sp. a22-2]NKN38206.1 hypothetical protein [Agrobacterium sp. a22-2]